jgi:hypothetical protein
VDLGVDEERRKETVKAVKDEEIVWETALESNGEITGLRA